MQNQKSKRMIFMISGAMDAILGAAALLIYFNILSIDIDIPRWIIGLVGAILFFTGIGVFSFFLFKTNLE